MKKKVICRNEKQFDKAVHLDGDMPQKCKASGCCEPIWEVNEKGKPLTKANKKIMEAFFKSTQS